MVDNDEWPLVAQGLINRGICGVMPLSSAFEVEGGKILGVLFGVPKNEVTSSGTPILRLMMGFRPINENFLNLGVTCAQLFQLEMRPHEEIIISSEDIRAMFSSLAFRLLGFGKVLPRSMNPPGSP